MGCSMLKNSFQQYEIQGSNKSQNVGLFKLCNHQVYNKMEVEERVDQKRNAAMDQSGGREEQASVLIFFFTPTVIMITLF